MKVFLGGTCNESKWRERMIPLLKIDYFNPVVDDWNEEARARELKERETADYCLYVITPRMMGTYSIAEVVDDSNKRPEKTIFVTLREDENPDGTTTGFKDAPWKSLQAVAQLVRDNGCWTFDSLEAAAEWMNE